MIEHRMLKTIHLRYSGRDGIRQIAKTLFSLWPLVEENSQITESQDIDRSAALTQTAITQK